MYGARLTRDFGESVPEVWRQAISGLNRHQIDRGLRRLTAGGSGSVPTLPQFMKACRMIGEDDGPSNPGMAQLPQRILPQGFNHIDAHGQKCMFAYLWDRGAASETSLHVMIAEKNKIVEQYRLIAAEDEVTGKEIKDRLFGAFAKVWRPITEEDAEAHYTSFRAKGFAANLSA
jgi:hypothetical protein